MKREVVPLYLKDIRQGADKLHDRFDGRVVLPDKLCVVLTGLIAALLPMGLLMLTHRELLWF